MLTNGSVETLSGRLLRRYVFCIFIYVLYVFFPLSYGSQPIVGGLALFDYSASQRAQRCSLVISGSCVFCGSYGFTHRPDFDAQVLVRAKTGKFVSDRKISKEKKLLLFFKKTNPSLRMRRLRNKL